MRKKKKDPEPNDDWQLCVSLEPERSGNYRVQRYRTAEDPSGETMVMMDTLYFDAEAKEWQDRKGNRVLPIAWMPMRNSEDKSPWITGME